MARKSAAVHPDVVASAELLAKQVWDGGGKPARLLMPQGLDPRHFVPILEYAVNMGWLRIQDAMVVSGHVNPRPVRPIGNPEGPSWGPGIFSRGPEE